jgi:hypothetical protein
MSWAVETVESTCPYCGEPVQLLVDSSAGAQQYIEDCQVCCRPMVVDVLDTAPVAVRLRDEDEV